MKENTFDPKLYSSLYKKEHYDNIMIRIPKGKKDEYKERAAELGKSLNQYFIDLAEQDLKGY